MFLNVSTRQTKYYDPEGFPMVYENLPFSDNSVFDKAYFRNSNHWITFIKD